MVLAEMLVGKISMGLMLHEQRAKGQEIAKDYAATLCLCG